MIRVAKVSLTPKLLLRLEKAISLSLLPHPTLLLRPLAHQRDSQLGQLLLRRLAPVGEIPKDLARQIFAQVRLGQELLGQSLEPTLEPSSRTGSASRWAFDAPSRRC
jgi:hypothetical protein